MPVGAIVGSAVIGGVGSLASGAIGAGAADKAAKAQTKANDKSLALQEQIFNTTKDTVQPWITAGQQATQQITDGIANGSFDISKYGMDELVQDPGYQFRLAQGTKALEGAAAARGNYISGDQLKAVSDYGQEAASQEFGNAFARTEAERNAKVAILQGQQATGVNAANSMANTASNYAANAASTIQNTGAAQAAGAINVGNAYTNAITGAATAANTGIENYALYNKLKPVPLGATY